MEDSTATSSGLFAVFLLSIYSLFLIPYTISYLCSAEEDATTQPVASKVGKRRTGPLVAHAAVTCSAATAQPVFSAIGAELEHAMILITGQEEAERVRQAGWLLHKT
jgi:hypothetical protein